MAYPISELVTRNLEEALRGVCQAAGCSVTLVVERARGEGNAAGDAKAILHEGDDQETDGPDGFKTWVRPYAVQVYLDQPASAAEPYGTRLNTVRAEVERELRRDPSRGGYAQDTVVREPQAFADANDATGVIVNLDVQYRHPEDDPFSLD